MEINIYAVLIWITAILIGSLDLVIFIGSKTVSSRAFAHSILWVTIWVACVGLFVSSRNIDDAIFFSRMTYYLGNVIAVSFLYFFLTYPDDKRPSKLFVWSLLIFEIIVGYFYLFTDKIIYDLIPATTVHSWGWQFGTLSYIFEISFFGSFIAGIYILYTKIKHHPEPNVKTNLFYMLWTIIVGASPASIVCIILPRLGYYSLNWLGPVTEIIWIPIMAYSIFKYRQMNVRAVVAEVLAIGMTIIFFINIFIQTPLGIWGRIAPFVIFMVLAIYLIRGVLREAEQKEQLTSLNLHLEDRVAEQTAEVRAAYDMEKMARRDLEKLNETKDQFIMITQHHLRTPVTSIRWELENMQSGVYGMVGREYGEAIERVGTATGRLLRIVDDFLSITALKVGTPILKMKKGSLRPLINDVLSELSAEIERRHITITMTDETTPDAWPEISFDHDKIREVLLIIIENAVRYNKDGGTISITTSLDNKHFELTVENTGLGFTSAEKSRIEGALFYRGDQAKTAHPTGMGIGLSVARAMMKAHDGTFSIHSAGTSLGAKVVVGFPLAKQPPFA